MRFDRVRIAIVCYGFICKGNTTHIIGSLIDNKRCGFVGRIFIVSRCVSEFCDNGISIGVHFIVIFIINANAIRNTRCDNGMTFAVVCHDFIRKNNCTHIVGCFCYIKRVRKVGGSFIAPLIIVFIFQGNRYGMISCIGLFISTNRIEAIFCKEIRLLVTVIYKRSGILGRFRYACFIDSKRCCFVRDRLVVCAIARERCRYHIFVGVGLIIARVFNGHPVGQIRCRDRMTFAVIGHGFVRKDNATHIISSLIDFKRCRQLQIFVVFLDYGCRNGIFARVSICICLVICNARTVGKIANGERFFRAVISRFYIFKRYTINGIKDKFSINRHIA